MSYTIRASLAGYNALTDSDPDHYALYADEDWVLIKEFVRGSVAVASGDYEDVVHNLSYVPTVMAYANDFFDYEHWVYGETLYSQLKMQIDTSKVRFRNSTGTSSTFQYYIFYDNV